VTVPNRIEKTIVLSAPLARVWRAISNSEEFGKWFGMAVDEPFVAGKRVVGQIRPTQVDPEIAKLQEPHTGAAFELIIERIEPERLLAFRWHPFAVDPSVDFSGEPTTLVEFVLAKDAGGTRLTITESGFEQLPLQRRADAFNANDGGWEAQTKLVEKYLDIFTT
jgi:uncharacterized protein YndB with AHSA1/START domain